MRSVLTHAETLEVLAPYTCALGVAGVNYEIESTCVGFHINVPCSELNRADLIIWHTCYVIHSDIF